MEATTLDWSSPEGQAKLALVSEMKARRLTWEEIAEALGVSKEGVKTAWLRRGQKVARGPVVYENLRVPEPESVEELRQAMLRLQAAEEALDTKQVELSLELPGDKPVAIAHTGDWHTGGRGVRYEESEADWDLLMSTDGVYVLGMGDYAENYISGVHPGSQFGQVLQPSAQYLLVKDRMRRAPDGKVLGLIRGCHENFTFRSTGEDVTATLCEAARCANLWHGATVTVKCGRETYTFHARHRYKYESTLNTTNAQRRMMENYGAADWAVLAHLHFPEEDTRPLMGARRSLLRSGSYKEWDEFGQQIGGLKGKPGVPVVIVWPDRHKHLAFDDLRDGLAHLAAT